MVGTTALTDVIASHFPEDFDWVRDIQEDIFRELAWGKLGPRYDFDVLRERIPKGERREISSRQYRIAVQVAQALNSAGRNYDHENPYDPENPKRHKKALKHYYRASRLLGFLEEDIRRYGSHLFEEPNNTTSFIDIARQAINEEERVHVTLDGRNGYTIGHYQLPQTAASPSGNGTNGNIHSSGNGHQKQPYVYRPKALRTH